MTRSKGKKSYSSGTEVLYINCPLCGMNRPLRKYREGGIRMTDTNLSNYSVLVTRIGGGRGSGFHRINEKSVPLSVLKEKAEYSDIIGQIKEQCMRILQELE